jgi:hypothetical protein
VDHLLGTVITAVGNAVGEAYFTYRSTLRSHSAGHELGV